MKHQSFTSILREIRGMVGSKGYSKSFAIPMITFTVIFTCLWFLWPLMIVGYFLATWASVGAASLAAWATFKVFLLGLGCLIVSFIGMAITPLVHEKLKE